MREVAFRASLVFACAVGAVVAHGGLAPKRPRLRPAPLPYAAAIAARAEAIAAAQARRRASDGVDLDAAPMSDGLSPTDVVVHASAAPPVPRGEGTSVDAFAAASDWKVLYGPTDDLGAAATPSTALRAFLAKDAEAAASIERSLGAPPWADATFQAAGLVGPPVAVLGRDFRAPAAAADSASWYAARAGVASGDARVVAATERLARFEAERAELVARVLDRVVELAAGRDDPDVVAYFVKSGRVHLLRTSDDAEVARLASVARRQEEDLRRRAHEVCE